LAAESRAVERQAWMGEDKLRLTFVFALLLTAPGLWAQEQEKQQETVSPEVTAPAEDSGPGLLSRGGFSWIRGETENLKFRPYAGAEMVYGGGMGTTSVDAQGRRVEVNAAGVNARYGVAGVKDWKKTEVQLDYRGSYRHYSEESFFDGAENSLLLSVNHAVNKRITVQFGQEAALYQNSVNLPGGLGSSYNPLASSLSGNELFDSPTAIVMSQGRVIYQRTARLSMSAGGSGFLVRRRSDVLMGMNGYVASGDIAYRMNRQSTIGVEYSFTHFGFINQFGTSDIHGVFLNYSNRLNRDWELALRLGGYRANMVRLSQVTIDPAIAALLGQGFAYEIVDRNVYAPGGDLHLTRRMRWGTWSVKYTRSVVPGNDVYLTSKNDSAGTAVSYNGTKRIAVNANVSYNRYSSLSQTVGTYNGYGGGGGVSIQLNRSFSLVGRANVYQRAVRNSSLSRFVTQATVGIMWSPGDYPLAIW
jgi:hypothetical protein